MTDEQQIELIQAIICPYLPRDCARELARSVVFNLRACRALVSDGIDNSPTAQLAASGEWIKPEEYGR